MCLANQLCNEKLLVARKGIFGTEALVMHKRTNKNWKRNQRKIKPKKQMQKRMKKTMKETERKNREYITEPNKNNLFPIRCGSPGTVEAARP